MLSQALAGGCHFAASFGESIVGRKRRVYISQQARALTDQTGRIKCGLGFRVFLNVSVGVHHLGNLVFHVGGWLVSSRGGLPSDALHRTL